MVVVAWKLETDFFDDTIPKDGLLDAETIKRLTGVQYHEVCILLCGIQ